MTTCDSSLLKAYEWDQNSWTLTVVFRSNNSVRAYAEVPPEVFSEMESAKSIGSFYNQNIKGKFESLKIDAVSDDEIQQAVAEKNVPVQTHEEFIAKGAAQGDDLGVTDEDILAVDPAYVDPRSSKVNHAPGTWHGVPLPPGTETDEEPVAEVEAPEPEILSSDQAVAVLSPKSPKVDKLTAYLHGLAAIKIAVTDAASQAKMEDHLTLLTNTRKAIFEIVDPYKAIAYQAYDAVQKLNKGRLDPADIAIKDGKQVLGAYLAAEQEKARKEQARLQAEEDAKAAIDQQRRTEALRLQVAQEQAEAGDIEQAEASLFDTSIVAAPIYTSAPRVEIPQASQFSGRKNWRAQVDDLEALVLDVAEGLKILKTTGGLQGHAPISMLMANEPQLNKRAKADERPNLFPGVRAWNDVVLASKKGK